MHNEAAIKLRSMITPADPNNEKSKPRSESRDEKPLKQENKDLDHTGISWRAAGKLLSSQPVDMQSTHVL